MSSNTQQSSWKAKGQSEEARYIRQKEETQLDAIRNSKGQEQKTSSSEQTVSSSEQTVSSSEQTGALDRDFEGGFGGQEDLEDRYATTSGEH